MNETEKIRLLYVDDEEINLINFKMAFDEEYSVVTASSGAEALAVFAEGRGFAMVVADQRMPGMTGVELLEKMFTINPEPVRIILTAYTDVQDIVSAINRGHIYQYITKPWDENKLRIILARAHEVYLLEQSNRLLLAELKKKNRDLTQLNTRLRNVNEQLTSDIARRKKVERALRDSEERYRTLVETMEDTVYAIDREGRFTYVSPAGEKLFGWPIFEMLGRYFMKSLSPACRANIAGQFNGDPADYNLRSRQVEVVNKNGTVIPVEVNATTLFDAEGTPCGGIGVARDITFRRREEKKRRELEIKMVSQAKLAALGELATGIAHEINQPLS